jgi:RimJ/RimL family protein N-acetyltransferase
MAPLALTPTLATRRLTLREPRREDAPVMARLVDDPDIARMTTGIPHPYPADAAEDFIEQRRQAAAGGQEAFFALEIPGEGFVGALGFDPGPMGVAEIGYWLGRPYWGRGLMTEAVRAALAWAGEAWGKRYLMAGHFADNPASGQVLIKAGFLYTGDVFPRFSLARGEEAPTRMMVWLA